MVRVLGIDVGSKNLALCLIEHNDDPQSPATTRIVRWAVISADGTTAEAIKSALDGVKIQEWLDSASRITVVIERQPSKNPTMTRIQHYLEMYAAFHSVPSILQDSKFKLFYAATTPWWPKDLATSEWTYARRKKLAVETAKRFLDVTDQAPEMRVIFAESSKKDDLADSLLHAMAYAYATSKLETSSGLNKKKKKVVARAPTAKQRLAGKLSPSNVKWALGTKKEGVDACLMKLDDQLKRAVMRAVKRHFGSLDGYFQALLK